jgi:CheY-like chemotaxis protein
VKKVILALVDDLLFTSKLRAAAKAAGVSVTFARSSATALEEMRRLHPTLVVLDLDNPRIDPIGTVSAMKADPVLAGIATVAYVSHVRADLIEQARQVGVNEILPRSAFTVQLPEILGRTPGPGSARA